MKKILLAIFFLAMTGLALAQTTKPKPATKPVATKPVSKPAAPKPALKTLVDSASYAIGVSVASFYKEQGITKLNTTLVAAAINDILSGKQPLLNEFTSNSVMNKLMGQLQEKKTKPAIDSGNAFLQRNKKRPEVKILPAFSGIG